MIAGHLQEKNGYFYAVLSYKDANGKRKTPWIATNLPLKGNKTRAEAVLLDLRQNYISPQFADTTQIKAANKDGLLFTDFLHMADHFLENGSILQILTRTNANGFYGNGYILISTCLFDRILKE